MRLAALASLTVCQNVWRLAGEGGFPWVDAGGIESHGGSGLLGFLNEAIAATELANVPST